MNKNRAYSGRELIAYTKGVMCVRKLFKTFHCFCRRPSAPSFRSPLCLAFSFAVRFDPQSIKKIAAAEEVAENENEKNGGKWLTSKALELFIISRFYRFLPFECIHTHTHSMYSL